MICTFKVNFKLRDGGSGSAMVHQTPANALRAAVAKYFRTKRVKDFSKVELERQIKYEIGVLLKNRSCWKITKVEDQPVQEPIVKQTQLKNPPKQLTFKNFV